MNARALGLLVLFAVLSSFAGTLRPVSSTFDEATQTWIGNVTELTNALWTAAEGDEIVLARGNYDLKDVAKDGAVMKPWSQATWSNAGSILAMTKSNMILRGATGDPRDVTILVSDNPGYRILAAGGGSKVLDLTMTGGNSTSDCGAYNFRGGGAIGMESATIVVSNCVFYGNKASRSGGAVSGHNGKYGTVIDCVFYANNGAPADGGMAGGNSTFINCVFSNHVTSAAATSYNSGVVYGSIVKNCLITNNVILNGALHTCIATDCRVIGNCAISTDWNNGWGGGAKNSVCTNCQFYGNSAWRHGGAGALGSFVNCTVISNCLTKANDYDGSGAGIYKADTVIGCTIVSNLATCTSGGGVAECAMVSNCVISYNAARFIEPIPRPNNGGGGGASDSVCYDCEFVGNLVVHGRGGGAMLGGSAYGCKFRDNSSSAFVAVDELAGCDIASSGGMSVSKLVDCYIHDCDNRPDTVRAVMNVACSEGIISNHYMYAFNQPKLMRGCLYANNIHAILFDWQVNSALFNGDVAELATRIENCTFADNVTYYLTRYFNTATRTISFVNTALVRNRTGVTATTYNDTRTMDTPDANLTLESCAFTAKTGGTADDRCVTVANPKFVGSGEHPYTPKTSSPLVKNKGVRLDWMDDALDLAGNPRLKDDQVDIGAYQCWLTAPGMMLVFR